MMLLVRKTNTARLPTVLAIQVTPPTTQFPGTAVHERVGAIPQHFWARLVMMSPI
jgi:hypothetical protein